MLISFIKYLMVLTTGLVIGYLIFTEKVDTEQVGSEQLGSEQKSIAKEVTEQSSTEDSVTKQVAFEPASQPILNKSLQDNNTDEDLIKQLTIQIETQNNKIAELEALLAQQKNENRSSKVQDEQSSQDLSPQAIETLSMQDFENKMKDQFLDRFKGYAIELEGERLESIKKEFNKDSSKSNWNADYENNINAFIQDNDPGRLHYVDELTCNSNMCRLKVNTNQPDNWQQLFLRMTQQGWYNSITLSENSGDPAIFIYFMTKPQNLS